MKTLFDRLVKADTKEETKAIADDLKLKVFNKFDLVIDHLQFEYFDTYNFPARGELDGIEFGCDTIVITLKGPWTYLSELHRDDVKLVDFNGKDHVYKSLEVSLDRDDKEYTCTIQL